MESPYGIGDHHLRTLLLKEKDQKVRESMGGKLLKVFARRYFVYGIICSLISFFSCKKTRKISRWFVMGLLHA
jgi:hypothetical protein